MANDHSGPLLLVYFHQGGIAMYPLLLCSILTVAIGIERAVVLLRAGRADAILLEALRGLLASNQAAVAVQRCAVSHGPLARIMQAVLAPGEHDAQRRRRVLERALARETGRLEQYMPVLATIGSVSPFIGLFGTVLGIMRAFRDIGIAGSAGSAIVAAGVAEALVATAAGLMVAVVAVVAYNHLTAWAQSIITNDELNAEELADLLAP